MDETIAGYLSRYADFDFDIDYEAWTVTFRKGDDESIKISRGEENIFIWCLYMALCERVIEVGEERRLGFGTSHEARVAFPHHAPVDVQQQDARQVEAMDEELLKTRADAAVRFVDSYGTGQWVAREIVAPGSPFARLNDRDEFQA